VLAISRNLRREDPAARRARREAHVAASSSSATAPAIWRGPIIMKNHPAVPTRRGVGRAGTTFGGPARRYGRRPASLAQSILLLAAIIVTTPQEMAVGDSLRARRMFERWAPVLGIVENMSYYVCPSCGERSELFLAAAASGSRKSSKDPAARSGAAASAHGEPADEGKPIVVASPSRPPPWPLEGRGAPRGGSSRRALSARPLSWPPHHAAHRLRGRRIAKRTAK